MKPINIGLPKGKTGKKKKNQGCMDPGQLERLCVHVATKRERTQGRKDEGGEGWMDAEQPATETTGTSSLLSSFCSTCDCLQGKLGQEPHSWSSLSLRLDSHLVLDSVLSLSSLFSVWFLCVYFVAFSP